MKLEQLNFIEKLAKKATKGNYILDSARREDDNHGGWYVDTWLEVENPFDQLNEKHYEEKNIEEKYRIQYRERETIVNPEGFTYRGPAQTAANAEYFAALSPEVIIELVKMAKNSLNNSRDVLEGKSEILTSE